MTSFVMLGMFGVEPLNRYTPKTPHNPKQLEKQASKTKRILRQRTQGPPSPMDGVINRVVKGCEILMDSAILLSEEVQDLRAAHEKTLQKRNRSKRQMARTGVLSIQEVIELMQQRNEVQRTEDTVQMETAPSTFQPRVRAPPRCSDCNVPGHKRNHCSNGSNN